MPGPLNDFFDPAQWGRGFIPDDPRFQQYARRYVPASSFPSIHDDPRFMLNETPRGQEERPRDEDRGQRGATSATPEPAKPSRLIWVGGVWVPEPVVQEDKIARERLAMEKQRKELAAIEAGLRAQRLHDDVRRQQEEEERISREERLQEMRREPSYNNHFPARYPGNWVDQAIIRRQLQCEQEQARDHGAQRLERERQEARAIQAQQDQEERSRAREQRARQDEEAEAARQAAAVRRDVLAAVKQNQHALPVYYIANPWHIQVPPLKPPYIRDFPVDSQGNYILKPRILQYGQYKKYPIDEGVRESSRRRRAAEADAKKEEFLRKGDKLQKKLAAAAERLSDAKKYQKRGLAGLGSDTVEQYERRLGVAQDDEARAKKAYEKATSDKRAWNEERRRNGW